MSGDNADADATRTTANWSIQCCQVVEFQKPSVISTGIGYLDHMIDQFYSHAQIGVTVRVQRSESPNLMADAAAMHSTEYINRHAAENQSELLAAVGTAIGMELRSLIALKCSDESASERTSTFACPLDEALTKCVIERHDSTLPGSLVKYTLPPYGIYPSQTGRTHIGSLHTNVIEVFWNKLAISSGLIFQLTKIRGHNAHHIVESSFKAFARALRNFFDNVNTTGSTVPKGGDSALQEMYGSNSNNCQTSIELSRHALVVRNTKETSIRTELYLDGGMNGILIDTGIKKLNEFLTIIASNASISLNVKCTGDLYIDEHHTAEDVAISIGQVLNDALGDKAGLNRMWSCYESVKKFDHEVQVIMDLSNRPCLTHNLSSVLETTEMIGDLSCEMFEHVLESIVVNARMTVHLVVERTEEGSGLTVDENSTENFIDNVVTAVARGFGQTLKYCSMVDRRRAGTTASSKGTLSV